MRELIVPVALALVAFVAGAIDAIAGGGGLLTVPALLVATGSPVLALGTNKGQSVFGALASLLAYKRAGRVDADRALPVFLSALAGSLAGARLAIALDPKTLRPVVLVLLTFAAIFFAVSSARAPSAERAKADRFADRRPLIAAIAIGGSMGVYDGFFGPGVGTLLIALFAAVFGDDLSRATANAKVANFASNLGALATFVIAGSVSFRLALPMAVGQTLGGVAGASIAVRGGDRLIRRVVVLVTIAIAARLAWQMIR